MFSRFAAFASLAVLLVGQVAGAPIAIPNNLAARAPVAPLAGVIDVYKREPKLESLGLREVPHPFLPAKRGLDVEVLGIREVPHPSLQARQNIPAEQAVTAPDGRVRVYGTRNLRRQVDAETPVTVVNGQIVPLVARQNIPAEQAVTAPDGVVRPYGKRSTVSKRQNIPAEQAVTAPDGVVRPYGKRYTITSFKARETTKRSGPITAFKTIQARQNIPAEQAVTAPNGRIKVYGTRNLRRQVDAETPVTVVNGQIVPLVARQNIPAEQAVTAPDGVVRPYGKRSFSPKLKSRQVDVETPVTVVNGQIVPLVARQNIPAEQAVTAPDGRVRVYGTRK